MGTQKISNGFKYWGLNRWLYKTLESSNQTKSWRQPRLDNAHESALQHLEYKLSSPPCPHLLCIVPSRGQRLGHYHRREQRSHLWNLLRPIEPTSHPCRMILSDSQIWRLCRRKPIKGLQNLHCNAIERALQEEEDGVTKSWLFNHSYLFTKLFLEMGLLLVLLYIGVRSWVVTCSLFLLIAFTTTMLSGGKWGIARQLFF